MKYAAVQTVNNLYYTSYMFMTIHHNVPGVNFAKLPSAHVSIHSRGKN